MGSNTRRKILLGNDDGILSTGMIALAAELYETADVYIAAPSGQQSGASHSITVGTPLLVEEVKDFPVPVKQAYQISGTPADCIKLALEELYKEIPFDFMISGINRGPNLGTDVFYSGTVAAAFEGFSLGLPSIAVSVNSFDTDYPYDQAAHICNQFALWWEKEGFMPYTLFNINTPQQLAEGIKRVAFTTLGKRYYKNVFSKSEEEDGIFYTMGGKPSDDFTDSNSDISLDPKGFVTITPIGDDIMNHKAYARLKHIDLTGEIF